MPVTAVSRQAAVSHLTLLASPPERSLAERMADVFVANDEEGRTTLREDLHREGFADAEIDGHQVEAVQIASRRRAASATRDVSAPREKSLDEISGDMADAIASLLPPTQLVVTELLARGFAPRHIDLLMVKARAKAALAFADGQTGWAN